MLAKEKGILFEIWSIEPWINQKKGFLGDLRHFLSFLRFWQVLIDVTAWTKLLTQERSVNFKQRKCIWMFLINFARKTTKTKL